MLVDLSSIAARVKAGVKLLDRKVPTWRTLLKQHRYQFDFEDGNCCVLGTIEHYSARMKQLKARGASKEETYRFELACRKLGLDYDEGQHIKYGFDAESDSWDSDDKLSEEYAVLDALWRAEAGIPS